jgi:hypothetical protein
MRARRANLSRIVVWEGEEKIRREDSEMSNLGIVSKRRANEDFFVWVFGGRMPGFLCILKVAARFWLSILPFQVNRFGESPVC